MHDSSEWRSVPIQHRMPSLPFAVSTLVRRACGACACACVAIASVLASGGQAATSSTVITAEVPSATSISVTACSANTAGEGTDLGVVLPGSSSISTADCAVTYGSSNDTARLRIGQVDRYGVGMFAYGGSVDATGWGTGGNADSAARESAFDAVRQDDGTVLVIGSDGADATVTKYTAAGTVDGSYGTAGTAYIDIDFYDVALAGELQSDGSLVVAGYTDTGNGQAFLARLDSDGNLDTAGFGTGGIERLNASTSIDAFFELRVLDDGRIMAAGIRASLDWFRDTRFEDGRPLVAMFDSAGNRDMTWGTAPGYSTVSFGGTEFACSPDAAAFLDDGSVMIVGMEQGTTGVNYVARFDEDGQPVTAVGGSGWDTIADPPGTWYLAQSATPAADGGIYVAGNTDVADPEWDVVVGKLDPTGQLDTSWGGGDGISELGDANPNGYWDDAYSVTELQDGRIVVGSFQRDQTVFRYRADGTLDTSFDDDGAWSRNAGGADEFDQVHRVVDIGDGRVLAVGTGTTAGATTTMFQGNPVPDYDADGEDDIAGNADDDDWTTTGAGFFGACLASFSGGGVTDGSGAAGIIVDPGGDCAGTDADAWFAIPATTSSPGSVVSRSTTTGFEGGSANLRFALRTTTTQAPGTYVAPIAFEVVAPDA